MLVSTAPLLWTVWPAVSSRSGAWRACDNLLITLQAAAATLLLWGDSYWPRPVMPKLQVKSYYFIDGRRPTHGQFEDQTRKQRSCCSSPTASWPSSDLGAVLVWQQLEQPASVHIFAS